MAFVKASQFWDNMLNLISSHLGSLLVTLSSNTVLWSLLIPYCLLKAWISAYFQKFVSQTLPSPERSTRIGHVCPCVSNPCGVRNWIGCATAPSSREKRKKETPWLYPHWQWPRSLGNATHCSGKFSWRKHSSIITEVFWTGERLINSMDFFQLSVIHQNTLL